MHVRDVAYLEIFIAVVGKCGYEQGYTKVICLRSVHLLYLCNILLASIHKYEFLTRVDQ